jgi:folate/biopterin transporter
MRRKLALIAVISSAHLAHSFVPIKHRGLGRRRLFLQSSEESSTTTSLVDVSSDLKDSTITNSDDVIQEARTSTILGMPITPEIVAIATIYFVEGALGLARLAQTYLLKDELHLGPAELSALSGLFVLPWTIKPVYGFLSDGFPLFGFRRKSYLVLAGLLGGSAYTILGFSGFWEGLPTSTSITGTLVALLVASGCIAMADVVADGIVVAKTRESKDPAIAGGLQSLCWGSAATGGLISAYFSGSLLEVMTVRQVFAITAVLPFLVALIAFGVEDKRVDPSRQKDNFIQGVKVQVEALWGALSQKAIWRPALFLFLWQATPTADGAFFFFLSNDLGLGPEFLGRVRLVTAAASLGGVWLYNQYLKTVKIKDILFWSAVASFPLGLIPMLLVTHVNRGVGIPDTALIYGDDVILAALGEMAFLPTLVLAARLCPPGVEAVLFATLMSIFNGAGTVGTEIGALLTKVLGVTENDFTNLAPLIFLCSLSSIFPLPFIGLLDEVGDLSEKEIEGES